MLPLLYLVLSAVVLAKSADIVVESLTRLSRYFGISQFAVGMVLLAVVTSLPELAVAVVSASIGEGAISAGNVFGSNIANILLVLGLGAFIYGTKVPRKNVGEIALVLLLTTVLSAYIVFSSTVVGRALGFFGGAMLLLLFAGYVYYLMKEKRKIPNSAADGKINKKKALSAFITFVAGIIVVFISSGFVVDNAVVTAREFGVAESFIGATIIAVGTSLPELSTGLQALRRKRYGIAIGNAIGSNMTNLTLVLGTTAVISEIYVNLPIFIVALLFAIVANAILLYYAAIREDMGKYSGALLLSIYALFIVVIAGLQVREIAV